MSRDRVREICASITRYSLLAILNCAALADTPRELIRQGNEHFAAGRFDEALATYEKVNESAESEYEAELMHNRAAVQFKLGRVDEARELWVRAASLKDAAFDARAGYNLGNCDYADALEALEAMQASEEQPAQPRNYQPVLDLLEGASGHYVDAIKLDPSLANARANLELAQMLKKQLEEQATTQPSSQQQEQSSTQPSDEQQSGQDNEQQDGEQQPTSQPSTSPGENQEQDQQQPQESEDEQEPQPASQPSEPESQPSDGQEPQSQPAREEQQQPPVPIEMTREQAERLLQKIRDMERARRAELARREAARHKAATRDW